MSISDKRGEGGGQQSANRKRFIDRHKHQIKRKIKESINRGKVADDFKDKEIIVDSNNTPRPMYDSQSGQRDQIFHGNDRYHTGDKEFFDPQGGGDGEGDGEASLDGVGESSIVFTRKELIELYFEDMELPNMVKEKISSTKKFKWMTGGFSKEGIPPRLSVKKSFKRSLARRLATQEDDYEPPFLLEDDLRYIRKYKVEQPVTQAVMICCMDVSYSMQKIDTEIAKTFYILLHLFLTKYYENIEVRFVRYHSVPRECNEEEFFYGKDSGGTNVAKAYKFIQEKIVNGYDKEQVNLYLAHASDGDVCNSDLDEITAMADKFYSNFQYTAYIQTRPSPYSTNLYNFFAGYSIGKEDIGYTMARAESDVHRALRKLFKKRGLE